MKTFKKLLRYLLIAIGVLIVAVGVVFLVLNESRPEGRSGPEAEALADKMLNAVNARSWKQTGFLKWSFPRGHDYVWNINENLAQVKWKDCEALIDPGNNKGISFENGERLSGDEAIEIRDKAIHMFWNDSFWLLAFTRVKDPGTVREIVELEDGEQGLLVTYESGGTTPGDSYLWLLDDTGKPKAWKMWTKILPIGGMEFSWEDWKVLPGGAWVAQNHKSILFDVPISNIRTANRLEDLGLSPFLFEELKTMP